jgi:hypothetical protein
VLIDAFQPTRWDAREIAATARHEAGALAARAGF